MKNILIVCTGNSCRSQMAEGYLRYFAKDKAAIYSAGIETQGVNPKAIEIMKEDGIDISGHTSNNIDEYRNVNFDFIITVCDNARERCPYFPSTAIKFHRDFPDPSNIKNTDAEIMAGFRRTRALIKAYCLEFVKEKL